MCSYTRNVQLFPYEAYQSLAVYLVPAQCEIELHKYHTLH